MEYPPTSEIIAEIERLDKEATAELAELKKLLTIYLEKNKLK